MTRNYIRKYAIRPVLFFAVLLLLGVALSGCGKKTAIGLVTKASKKLERVNSAQGNVGVNLLFGYDIGITRGSIPIGAEFSYEYTVEPAVMHLDGAVKLPFAESALEAYILEEGGSAVTYVKTLGHWFKQTSGVAESMGSAAQEQKPDALQLLTALLKLGSEMTLAEELGSCNGREAYVITLTVTGETLKQLLTATGISINELIMAEHVDYSKVSADVTIYIDKETEMLGGIFLDIKGMEQFIDISLLGMSFGSFESLTVSMNYTGFDTVEAIVLPEEAKGAPEMPSA